MQNAFTRTTGYITILSGVLAIASIYFCVAGVNFDMDALADPTRVFATNNHHPNLVKYGMILDLFGYYLLLLPAVFFLHRRMQPYTAWTNLVTFCGLGYVFIGSLGASILAYVWPNILQQYLLVSPSEQQLLRHSFKLVNDIVYGGMWNLLEMILAGVWWVGNGLMMLNEKKRGLGWLTLLTGCFCLLDGMSCIINSESLHEIALNLYLVSAIAWALTIGLKWSGLLSRPFKKTKLCDGYAVEAVADF